MRRIEYQYQIAVVNYLSVRYPKIMFNADCGGMRTTWSQAVKSKVAGHAAGFPDIFIAWPSVYYHGLFIEMKAPKSYDSKKGQLKRNQKEWLDYLNSKSYYATVCYGSNEAIEVIDKYLAHFIFEPKTYVKGLSELEEKPK
jgi:hypothetical protein